MIRLVYENGAIVEASLQRDGVAGEVLIRKDRLAVAMIRVSTSEQAAAFERTFAQLYAELAVDESLVAERMHEDDWRHRQSGSVIVHERSCACTCPEVAMPTPAPAERVDRW